jgi:hypothetical protein
MRLARGPGVCCAETRSRGRRLKSYLISWLKKRVSGDMEAFEREHPGPWLVWEAGPWRPPSRDRTTLIDPGEPGRSSSGDALALLVEPRPGRARSDGVRLGRGPENDMVVDDGTLSRMHLLLRVEGGRWTVEDLRSSNGTKVDGMPLDGKAVPIESGSRIDAGTVRLTFYDSKGLYLRLKHGVA